MPPQFAEIWKQPPRDLELRANEAHLWLASIPDCAERLAEYESVLTDEERHRAGRFHFERDRQRYAIARGILRRLLQAYVGDLHASISCNPYGKPALADETTGLRFNVGHSRDLALFGFAREREIGVDIEWMRPDFATTDVAERFFAPDEAVLLAALPEAERTQGFFNCWTRKEAYVKARGLGLSLPLHSFAVTLTPGEPAALVRVDGDPEAPQRWLLESLETVEGYRAAVAIECRECALRFWRWTSSPG